MPKFPKNTGYKMKPKRGELFNYDRSAFDDAPIIKKKLEKGVKAEANKDGSIYVDPSVDLASKQGKKIIEHEKVHLDQFARGDLDYDAETVTWKGETINRKNINEGAKNLPWEKEAYDKTENA
jgi:hypothetical protein|tara:strand:+ start:54 stop:422 length:369 start_codon:yes stop_codon:yes gene_type:complete